MSSALLTSAGAVVTIPYDVPARPVGVVDVALVEGDAVVVRSDHRRPVTGQRRAALVNEHDTTTAVQ